MIKRNSILKKVSSYSVLAGSILAASEAYGQILYHKITPFDTIPANAGNGSHHLSGSFSVDLNGDGVNDFFVVASEGGAVSSLASRWEFGARCSAAKVLDSTNSYIGALKSGQSIGGKSGHWKAPGVGWLLEIYAESESLIFSSKGNWKNQLDKFVGVRLRNKTTGDFNYGWIRLSVEFIKGFYEQVDTGIVIVKDYAYEQIPNKPIIAGDMGTCTPAVSLFASGHKTFPVGDSATLNVLGFRDGDVVTWFHNGNILKTGTDKSLVVKEHGQYSALVKNKNGCGQVTDTIQIKTFMPGNAPGVMMKGSAISSEIYAFDKTLFGRLTGDVTNGASVIIYNELGTEVLKQAIVAADFSVPLQSLTTGIYFVQLLNGGEVQGKKIFVK